MTTEPKAMLALAPCPFCGGEAAIDQLGSSTMSCIVICTECGCRHESGNVGILSGRDWNTRTASAGADTAMREALEKSRNAIKAVYLEIDKPSMPACLASAWETANAALSKSAPEEKA